MNPQRILVIRRDNIGDLVCTTPAIAALRARFPDAHIAALVNSYNAEVLGGNPHLDAVHSYTKLKHREPGQSALGALRQRAKLLLAIRRQRFDVAVLGKSSWDRHGLRLARQCGVAQTIGYATPEAGKAQPDFALPAPGLMHEVQAVGGLLAPLGITGEPGPLQVYPDAALAAQAEARFTGLGVRPRLALHLSAREATRRWPAEKWIALARDAAAQGWGLVLFWSPGPADDPRHPGDDAFAQEVRGALEGLPVVACPTHGLGELVAAFSRCHAFVGADGGAMHLAAAAGLPMAALFENTPDKTLHWYPWHVPHRVVCGPGFEVGSIPADAVLQALAALPRREPIPHG
ncbi:glycosyltransferase family 9 protein [Niveibacterium sp. SC-1]|uniref:glycosyltransferase family 9 protein n=1 Tax=Niveibacterium sp. SC-1 TaxID=3135646 RepID=UPI00311D96C6